MNQSRLRHIIVDSIREIIFGLEDSFVSTLGTITGIAVVTHSTYVVILSGLVLLAAESTSMGAGSYLSSKTATQARDSAGRKQERFQSSRHEHPLRAGFVMFVFYVLGGIVPLGPYFLFPIDTAIPISILLTVFALLGIGIWSAEYTKRPRIRSGLEMAGISLGAALLGIIVGQLVHIYFGVDVAV